MRRAQAALRGRCSRAPRERIFPWVLDTAKELKTNQGVLGNQSSLVDLVARQSRNQTNSPLFLFFVLALEDTGDLLYSNHRRPIT